MTHKPLWSSRADDPIGQRLDSYASEGAAWDENGQKISRWLCAEKAFVGLRAVLDRHGPMQYGDEATSDDLEPADLWCKECSGDRFHRARFPCPTHIAIAEALGRE